MLISQIIHGLVLGAGHKANRLVLQCINGASSNPVEGRTKIWQLKDLILTLFCLSIYPGVECVCGHISVLFLLEWVWLEWSEHKRWIQTKLKVVC
jgi:hypothetical protein